MQDVFHRFPVMVVLMVWLAAAAGAQPAPGDIRPSPLASAMEALRDGEWDKAADLAARAGPVARDIVEWQRLLAGRGSYAEMRDFVERRLDWPRLDAVVRASEGVVAQQNDTEILNVFAERPAQTAQGIVAHAGALSRAGRREEADALIVRSWRTRRLSDPEHGLLLTAYGDLLQPHHWARLDAMLWRGATSDARRMFPLVSDGQRALAEARLGLAALAGNVDTLIAAVPKDLLDDPGLVHGRFEWRVRKGRWDEAKEMLLAQSKSAESLGNPGAWANRRRQLARDELLEGSAERAYEIAAKHHLAGGSDLADLEWLAGYIALTRMDDPARALTHFQQHDDEVVTPISQGRAGYWKGRAYEAMGDRTSADMEYTRGAAFQTSFYGLLAAEAAGLPFDVGLDAVPKVDWRDSPLVSDSLFQAGQLLLAAGERNLAELFWTQLAEQLGEHDAALLGQAAIDLDEPHLAVMIGKAVARWGVIAPIPYYPLHPLAKSDLPVPAELALSIARRESEFDPGVVSGAGARGLMQVMPATARQVAAKLGLLEEHSTARLTADPVYNGRIGTDYLAQLIDRFDGNIVMVSAGYNAGPSRPARWMEEFGDPRGKDIDAMLDWIEGIPFRETRNYVMRVSESLPIFRARLGLDPLPVPFSAEILGNTLKTRRSESN